MFNDHMHFYVSPHDAKHLLLHSIELVTEQVCGIKKAENYFRQVASLKDVKEQSAFLALAQEYQQLLQKFFLQLSTLRGTVL